MMEWLGLVLGLFFGTCLGFIIGLYMQERALRVFTESVWAHMLKKRAASETEAIAQRAIELHGQRVNGTNGAWRDGKPI